MRKSIANRCGIYLCSTLFSLGCGLGQPEVTRVVSEVCDNNRSTQNFDPKNFPRTTGGMSCESDSECTEGLNGRCVLQRGLVAWRYCNYDECFDDGDCGQKEACSCGQERHKNYATGRADENACVPANCRTDQDCGNQFCRPDHGYSNDSGDRVLGYYCTTSNDECRTDLDCQEAGAGGARCTLFGGTSWSCMGGDG